jgi:hypothetical protein
MLGSSAIVSPLAKGHGDTVQAGRWQEYRRQASTSVREALTQW